MIKYFFLWRIGNREALENERDIHRIGSTHLHLFHSQDLQ